MKSFTKSLIAAAFLLLAGHPAFAAECKLATEKEFLDRNIARKIPILTLTKDGQAKFNAHFAEIAKTAVPEDAKTYIGVIGGGMNGIVMMSGGCVMEGTIATLPAEALALFMKASGIVDGELIPYVRETI